MSVCEESILFEGMSACGSFRLSFLLHTALIHSLLHMLSRSDRNSNCTQLLRSWRDEKTHFIQTLHLLCWCGCSGLRLESLGQSANTGSLQVVKGEDRLPWRAPARTEKKRPRALGTKQHCGHAPHPQRDVWVLPTFMPGT